MTKKERLDRQGSPQTDLKERVKKPRRFKVIIHNDDFTTMEFVVEILMNVFRKNQTEATRLMLMVHHKGMAVAGVYTHDIAETKKMQVIDAARAEGHPFMCTIEPE